MSQVRVFNPLNSPVAIGDGRTIGGAEHQMVDLDDTIQSLIDSGELIQKVAPVEEPVKATEESSPVVEEPVAEDSPSDETDVSSVEAVEVTNDEETSGEETDEATPVDEPENAPTPATISKNRRRKSPPVKE